MNERNKTGRHRIRRWAAVVALSAAALGVSASAEARPAYFEQFKTHYGISPGDNLDACGVCHFRWLGTGARNPFGSSVEQQLYLGKTIVQSLTDVEGMDPDNDGFTSGDEIINWMTLPGYNCENFVNAQGAPTGYDTYITPGVPTCLDPLDIRANPTTLGSVNRIGDIEVMQLEVINNGSSDPLEISSYGLLPGAPAALSVSGPMAPFTIPLGESVILEVTFAPTSSLLSNSTLRIVSNDPDEANLDVQVTVLAAPDPTAPGAQRAPCFESIRKALAKYARLQLRQWTACYMEELAGRACDTGARDLKLERAAEKLAAVIGGEKDKTCSAAGLSSLSLGFPSTCSEGCEEQSISGMDDIPVCLICQQDRVMEGVLRDGLGTAPPDLPPNLVSNEDAYACQERIIRAFQKSVLSMFSELAECELAAVLADENGGSCQTELSATLAELRATLDASVDKCASSADLLGCRFEGMLPDAQCLGLSAQSLAVDLTNTMFGIYEP